MHRLAAILVAAGLLAACQTTESTPDPNSFAQADLLHAFDKSAYGWEFSDADRDFVIRYDKPVDILLVREQGDAAALASFNRVVGFIRNLYRGPEIGSVKVADLQSSPKELLDDAEMIVFAVGPAAYEAVHERLTRNHMKTGRERIAELFYFQRCGAFLTSDQGRIKRSIVMLDVEQNTNREGHLELDECFAEEMLQGLGLPNDHDSLQWSMFNDNNEIYWPGEFDRLLLSMLYSEELEPGMSRQEASQRLPGVIDRLWPEYQASKARASGDSAG